MCRVTLSMLLVVLAPLSAAAQQAIVAKPKADVAAAHFAAVLQQALGAIAKAGSYALDVESKWGATADPQGPQGGSKYKLVCQANKYRVEVQSSAAQAAELLCVNDGAHVTTYFPARKLYSQHAVDSPQASLEANKMLAMSLQGSAIDILLQRDVAGFVHSQVSQLTDHGDTVLAGKKTHHFELLWGGAKVQLWFAAEGEPLLLQFTRTTFVPTAAGEKYEQVCTAKFKWQLGAKPAEETFALAIPKDARRVKEIYEALSGEESAVHVGQLLPKLQLAKLDGSEVELAAASDKKATVLIFWATWCASSVEDLPAVSQFVKAYKDRGVAFYAINVGEQPGEVRRFTAKSPLVSSVLLDPRGKASSALHVKELPAIAIVGPDNNVRVILHGTAKALQSELTAQLDGLLSGSSANTARLPGETTARPK
jgi:thiol-disulfide isomerase/thioredoxin